MQVLSSQDMAYNQEKIKPYSPQGVKSEQVEAMFDGIASTYDFLNHVLSLGIDRGWRRKAVEALGAFAPRHVLDVATGTGDFAILEANIIHPEHITGTKFVPADSEGDIAARIERNVSTWLKTK